MPRQEYDVHGGPGLVGFAVGCQFLHSKAFNVWILLQGLLTAVSLWCFIPSGRRTLGPINMPVTISEQSKDSDRERRTLARMGDQPSAPGAVVLKQNLMEFQLLQQVAQNTDILFRQVGEFRVLYGKLVSSLITEPVFSRIAQT